MKNPVLVRFNANDQPKLVEIGPRDLITVSVASLNASKEVVSRYAFAAELVDVDCQSINGVEPLESIALNSPEDADGFTYGGLDVEHE